MKILIPFLLLSLLPGCICSPKGDSKEPGIALMKKDSVKPKTIRDTLNIHHGELKRVTPAEHLPTLDTTAVN